ncbi:MAG: class I SAM-dependent methyltransferase [Cyclobacteriaceae bacterium]
MSILDVGVINRNIKCADLTQEAIEAWFDVDGSFLDYAGGYGILVRLMRDKGYDFVRSDKYSENLFASFFDINDSSHTFFEMITGFEVMEHLENPLETLEDIFSRTKNFLFSTELIPFKKVNPENWWYFAAEGGQHISFYSAKTLKVIAEIYDVNYFNIHSKFHLFSKDKIDIKQLKRNKRNLHKGNGMNRFLNKKTTNPTKKSLLMSDYELVRKHLKKEKG